METKAVLYRAAYRLASNISVFRSISDFILQGLIKIRGDQCWRDLTCMNYHYEVDPSINPLISLPDVYELHRLSLFLTPSATTSTSPQSSSINWKHSPTT